MTGKWAKLPFSSKPMTNKQPVNKQTIWNATADRKQTGWTSGWKPSNQSLTPTKNRPNNDPSKIFWAPRPWRKGLPENANARGTILATPKMFLISLFLSYLFDLKFFSYPTFVSLRLVESCFPFLIAVLSAFLIVTIYYGGLGGKNN